MKKVVTKDTIIWSVFLGHSVIISSLFIFRAYNRFDVEEFNEFFWYLYPILVFWSYKAYQTVIDEDNLSLSFKSFRTTLFFMFVMQFCITIKALAPWIINFSELKITTFFIEFIICIYLFFKIIEARSFQNHNSIENGF